MEIISQQLCFYIILKRKGGELDGNKYGEQFFRID